jgi:hypothetical protein
MFISFISTGLPLKTEGKQGFRLGEYCQEGLFDDTEEPETSGESDKITR